jgi:hypothetical protein
MSGEFNRMNSDILLHTSHSFSPYRHRISQPYDVRHRISQPYDVGHVNPTPRVGDPYDVRHRISQPYDVGHVNPTPRVGDPVYNRYESEYSRMQQEDIFSDRNLPPQVSDLVEMFSMASKKGDIESMEHLMDDGVDVNSTNKRGTSALYEAARSWQCEAVKFLISRGADVNAKDKYGDTPMYSVVFNSFSFTLSEDYVEIISTLLKHGADVNYHRSNTRSLLANVVEKITEPGTDSRKFQLETCELMLKAGAHIDDNTNVDMGYTPLHVAINTQNDELLTLLLDEGNSVEITAAMEITDKRGRTPLQLAQERGFGNAVGILHHHHDMRRIQKDMESAVMVQVCDVTSEEYKQFEHNARLFRRTIPPDAWYGCI